MYFDTNIIENKPQNIGSTGFNDWGTVEYKPDPDGIGLLLGIGINSTTSLTYDELISLINSDPDVTANVDSNGLIIALLYSFKTAGILTESLIIKKLQLCQKANEGNVYFKYINSLGGYTYELMNCRIDSKVNVSEKKLTQSPVTDIFEAAKKEYTINSKTRYILSCYKNNIQSIEYLNGTKYDNIEKWNDFKRMTSKNDIFVFNSRFSGAVLIENYNSTITGTLIVTCPKHRQNTGDTIIISGTSDYNNTHTIIVISEDEFIIRGTFTSDQTGYFKRNVMAKDWLRCQIDDVSELINTNLGNFNIKFDVLFASDGL